MSERPKEIDFSKAAARISGARRVLITTHARADGDAIGSALGLFRAVRSIGRDASVYLHEHVPPRYDFLPDVGAVQLWHAESEPAAHLAVDGMDLIVIVDTCAIAQLDKAASVINASSAAKLAIDHHVTRDSIVDEIVLDSTAGSCAQMIAQLCDAAGWPIDAETATLLFTGMATDTGWFRFSNADARVFEIASRLIKAGVKPNELYERLYLNEPEPRVRLIGAVASSFELRSDGRLAVIRITQEMLRRCGANSSMTEEVINESHRVGSVIASVMLVEPATADEPVRVSFRSKRDVNVAAVACHFGGGGHERAAGAKLREPFEEAVGRVTAEMEAAVARAS